MDRKTLVAETVAMGLDDGTGTLGIIIDQALAENPNVTAEDIAEIVREAREEHAASDALSTGDRVEAGEGEDHDTGVILSVEGISALVGWDSGVRTSCPLADLRPTTERHSGGHRAE